MCSPCYATWRYRNDPERFKDYARSQWAKRQQARTGAGHTEAEWLRLLETFEYRCAYCKVDIRDAPSKDHVIPITKVGVADDSIKNILPCCRRCNFRKGSKSVAEYLRILKRDELKP
jgi:5-methylcytosine-specific restriction endonuclease McrA